MFKKAKSSGEQLAVSETNTPALEPKSLPSASRQSTSVIGSKTQLHGDINSDEDLTIEGQVTGTITCKQHTVKLGASGILYGDAYAHTLRVSGKVEGSLVALHKVTIHGGAHVTGTITTPCLVLEDGSTFHGTIDMNPDNAIFERMFTAQPTKASASEAGKQKCTPSQDDIHRLESSQSEKAS
ncbi:bactofilin family protein [Vreelandella lutescens]|uniref:Polymer-forming cytoskeletal protein n=1 Tax=Vreelandella lutescens TaxID=1602943 RepID=A0ABQ1NM32_9GAMM|nr:polymer-forming cytoskeletal protein [Halomonas lutescens]GGC79858.1 hypothetical protein GCM10011382_07370 [Halomonas lutescens]